MVGRRSVTAASRPGRRVARALPVTACLVVVVAALALTAFEHWRRGAATLAVAAGLAAVLRLVLPDRAVGTLAVRSRRFDVVFLLVLTALLTALAFAISDPG